MLNIHCFQLSRNLIRNIVWRTYYLLHSWNRNLLQKLTAAQLVRELIPFMEHEVSLPCTQNFGFGFYPGHIKPVYTLQPTFFKINFNIIPPSNNKSWSTKWFLSLLVYHRNCELVYNLRLACYLSHPFYTSWFNRRSNTGRRVATIRNCLIKNFPPLFVTEYFLDQNILLSTLFPNTLR
jgi:hypothetical protein